MVMSIELYKEVNSSFWLWRTSEKVAKWIKNLLLSWGNFMLSKMTLHEFLLETDFLGATQLLVSYFLSFSFLFVYFCFYFSLQPIRLKIPTCWRHTWVGYFQAWPRGRRRWTREYRKQIQPGVIKSRDWTQDLRISSSALTARQYHS